MGIQHEVRRRIGPVVRPRLDRLGTSLLAPPRTGFGSYHQHGDRSQRTVSLTFDDGPSRPSTESMLDVLDDLDVQATFFCVGEMVEWYPDIVQRAHHSGHIVASHSMYHSRAQAASLRSDAHLTATDDAIERAIGMRPSLYRPPWGWLTPWEARRVRRRGQTIIGWDVYPDDWKDPETDAAVTAEQVCSRVQPGSIILMHDATSNIRNCQKTQSAIAVRIIVERLRADGYAFVTIPEMLGVSPYAAESTHD